MFDAAGRRTRTVVPAVSYPQERCEGVMYGPFNRPNQTCGLRFPYYPNANVIDLLIPADTSRFVFDQAGQLLGAYNTRARIDRRYLPAGALQVDTLRIREVSGANFSLTYAVTPSYDLSGRRTRLLTPWSADSIRYAYDRELGVLNTVWQGNARLRFTYDLAGRQDSLFIGSGNAVGVTETRSYDADGMLRKRVRTSATLGNLITDSIAYDLRDKMVDVFTQSRAADVGTLEYHNRYSALGAVLAQQRLKLAANWDLEEFRTTGMGDVYRSRTFHSDGDNGFPTLSTYNQFGALVGRGPLRDLTIPNGSGYQDSTETVVDDAGNVGWTQTYSLGYHTSDPERQTITRSYFGADNTLRFQQRYAVSASAPPPGSPPPPQKGSWEAGNHCRTTAYGDGINVTATVRPGPTGTVATTTEYGVQGLPLRQFVYGDSVEFCYDEYGRRAAARNRASRINWTYDGYGRMTCERQLPLGRTLATW